MQSILFVSADLETRADALRVAECLFPGKTLCFSDLNEACLADVAMVVADIDGASGKDLNAFKAKFDRHPGIQRLGLADFSKRKDQVQAKAIGVSEVVDRRTGTRQLVSMIRDQLGTYGQPLLAADTPENTAQAVMAGCAVLEDASVAAVLNSVLPIGAAATMHRKIGDALETDGLDALLEAVQSHHSHTFCHSMLVTVYAVAFAEALGLPEEERAFIGAGALIHDLGKVRIPLSILDKPGKLDDREMAVIKKHPVFGRELVEQRSDVPKKIVDMMVSHHEYLDGSGYPAGLTADQIGLDVRIITICDIYAALTERRSYKESYSPRQAFAVLLEMKGKIDQALLKQFRPVVFPADVNVPRRGASLRVASGG
ncbi:HD-GYP domain-containing protein [Roseibium litorale]|uniref:HD domain-containing protein n=1 Tax=Roseibium litorale TaxID=2803841 RepID=A0ABR9CLC9_9HYPH|nr:HD domain-containing phosphohydrolase [Roseibium litorale]MBD8891359.1 HD domain-containing protein [Roseibium litorale]